MSCVDLRCLGDICIREDLGREFAAFIWYVGEDRDGR